MSWVPHWTMNRLVGLILRYRSAITRRSASSSLLASPSQAEGAGPGMLVPEGQVRLAQGFNLGKEPVFDCDSPAGTAELFPQVLLVVGNAVLLE